MGINTFSDTVSEICNVNFHTNSTCKSSGLVMFWYGPESSDPCNLISDPDPNIFVSGFQDTKILFFLRCFCLLFIVGT